MTTSSEETHAAVSSSPATEPAIDSETPKAKQPKATKPAKMARKYPNVYLDTGAIVMTRYIEQAVDELGPARIVYGSDER